MFHSRFRWLWLSGALLLLIFVVLPHAGYAATDNGMDSIVKAYKIKAAGWESVLSQYAQSLFWILALLEFAWTGIRLTLKGADFGEILSEIVSQILFIGFFYFLLTNFTNISHNIIDSMTQAASAANAANGAGPGLAPSDVFDSGMDIIRKIISSISIWDPSDSILLALAALAVLVGFGMMTAFLVMTMVESYFIISAGVILMGFGGSGWTKEYAINTIRFMLSIGVKLFLAQLVIGIGQSFITDLATTAQTGTMDVSDAFYIAGISLIFMALTKGVPDMACGWVRGDSHATGAHLTGIVTAAAAAGAEAGVQAGAAIASGGSSLAGGGAGAVSAIKNASKLAGEKQKDDMDAKVQSSFLRRALDTGNSMARETGKATMENMGRHWRGEENGGNFGMQVGKIMSDKADALKATREQKASSSSSSDSSSENKIYTE